MEANGPMGLATANARQPHVWCPVLGARMVRASESTRVRPRACSCDLGPPFGSYRAHRRGTCTRAAARPTGHLQSSIRHARATRNLSSCAPANRTWPVLWVGKNPLSRPRVLRVEGLSLWLQCIPVFNSTEMSHYAGYPAATLAENSHGHTLAMYVARTPE